MSEANILNATSTSALNPNFNWVGDLPQLEASAQAKDGAIYSRRTSVRGRSIGLQWLNRPLSTRDLLEWWYHQYEHGYFTYADLERGRYYTGRFMGGLRYTAVGYDRWNIETTFVELPNLPMYQYPSVWGSPNAIFMEEKDDYGNDLVKLKTSANWAAAVNANHHNGSAYTTATLNETAEWLYYGYGFRVWSYKGPDRGIVEVSLDGTVVSAALDLYTAGVTPSAAVFTKADVNLGEHIVKLRCTNTKNGASSATTIMADAIEVMR